LQKISSLAALALLLATSTGVLAEGMHLAAAGPADSRPVSFAQLSVQTAQASPLSELPPSVQQQIDAAAAQAAAEANAEDQAEENNENQQEVGADEGAAAGMGGGAPAATDPGNGMGQAGTAAEANAEGADEAGTAAAAAQAEAAAQAQAGQPRAAALFATSSVETSLRRRE
jgi:hypothetical protein